MCFTIHRNLRMRARPIPMLQFEAGRILYIVVGKPRHPSEIAVGEIKAECWHLSPRQLGQMLTHDFCSLTPALRFHGGSAVMRQWWPEITPPAPSGTAMRMFCIMP